MPFTEAVSLLSDLKNFKARMAALTAERDRLVVERDYLIVQRDALESERDSLRGHCERLNRELEALAVQCRSLSVQLEESARQSMSAPDLVQRMRVDWDDRARLNASYYTNSAKQDWSVEEYFETGEANVREEILNDMENICQGDDPASMRVLEIGCGAGRMTKALARIFGEVHAVDISAEMIATARSNLSGVPNVHFYQTNGSDVTVLPDQPLDFAFSYIVFQHIPSAQVIESYVRDVGRHLKPGRLFKFQVQGGRSPLALKVDTWLGADFSVNDMQQMAERCGFEMRYWHGAGTQYFWLWFFKKP